MQPGGIRKEKCWHKMGPWPFLNVNITFSHVWMELNNAGLHGENLHSVKPTEMLPVWIQGPDVVIAIPCGLGVWWRRDLGFMDRVIHTLSL